MGAEDQGAEVFAGAAEAEERGGVQEVEDEEPELDWERC